MGLASTQMAMIVMAFGQWHIWVVKHGMKKFVQSAGKYNPSDELGTSLQDYYDKFAVQS